MKIKFVSILARNTVLLSNKRPDNHDYSAWHYENGYLVNKATGKVLTKTTSTSTGLKIADQIGATSNQHTTNPTLLTTQPNQFTTIPQVTTQFNQFTTIPKVTTQFNQFTTIPKVTTQPNQFTTTPKVTTNPNQVPNVNTDQSFLNNHQMIENIDNPDPTQQWILDYNGKLKISTINDFT